MTSRRLVSVLLSESRTKMLSDEELEKIAYDYQADRSMSAIMDHIYEQAARIKELEEQAERDKVCHGADYVALVEGKTHLEELDRLFNEHTTTVNGRIKELEVENAQLRLQLENVLDHLKDADLATCPECDAACNHGKAKS